MIHYYIHVKSDNKELDKSWYESAQDFHTDLPLFIGQKISFNNSHSWQSELTKDYNTTLFKIVDEIANIDDMGSSDIAINAWVDIFLEPFYNDIAISNNTILKQNIDMQDLSTRLINILHIENIYLVEDLTNTSLKKVKNFKSLGKKSLNELLAFMKTNNLSFKV